MKTTLTTKIWGDTYGVRADWAQASDQVFSLGEDGWHGTQYQVASFQHSPEEALRRILETTAKMSGGEIDDDEINDAIERSETD